jgi:AcrR family transcriptional regulator
MSSADRRDAILAAAARLFRHYGHAKTTMADVAREAHVGVGSVYLEFSSKEVIVEELSSTVHERVLGAMRRAAQHTGTQPFAVRLSRVLEVRVKTFRSLADEGQHACELVHCKADGVRSAHARYREAEHAFFQQLLHEARERGEVAPEIEPRRAATLLQRAYATLSPPWLFDLAADEALATSSEMCRLLLSGLHPRAGEAPSARARSRPRSR